MKKREEIRNWLLELIDEDETLTRGEPNEVIYLFEDLVIYGGFEMGYRGTDHRALMGPGISWEDIAAHGVIGVPETQVYVSPVPVKHFEKLGFERMDTK